jgi:hypothetical protein
MAHEIQASIDSIEKCLREAGAYFGGAYWDEYTGGAWDNENAEYYMEQAFVELLVLTDHLNLEKTHQMISVMYESARTIGFLKSEQGPDELYLIWPGKLRMILNGISAAHGIGESTSTELIDLKNIIRRAVYVICDTGIFPFVPKREADVHDRLEGILKCYFSDLKRKPSLSKAIKNFEPDSGIQSLKTLIEYKFVTSKPEAKIAVDQILADVSGYQSPQWSNLLFVIYETHRLMPESEWKALLKECKLGKNYDVIVLSGDSK